MTTTEAPRIDKAWIARQMQTNLARMLSPGVCAKVLASLRRGADGFGEVADALRADPYVTAKVVGMANLLTRPGQLPGAPVTSIERAVQMLGMRHVEMLVLSVMLTGPLMAADPHVPRRMDLWRWVISCGVAGNHVGQRLAPAGRGRRRDDAPDASLVSEHLVHGLVLGLGTLILNAGLGRAYEELLGVSLRPMSLASRERKQLGADHYQVTAWALELMRCPPDVCPLATAMVDAPDSPLALQARAIEALGAMISANESGRAGAFLADAFPRLGLDPAGLFDEDAAMLRAQARELSKVFQLDLGDWREQQAERQRTLLDAGNAIESLVIDRLTMIDTVSDGLDQSVRATRAAETAQQEALTDPLTGLLNRRGWELRGRELETLASRTVGVLLMDLDHFKAINDRFGHGVGDEVLTAVARAINAMEPGPLLAGRLGGDEFAAAFVLDSIDQLQRIAEKLRQRLLADPAGAAAKPTISIGGTLTRGQRLLTDWPEVYPRADANLYQAKRQGRDRVVVS
jgi:diguanylate cyclase (GGDEF)-like protein